MLIGIESEFVVEILVKEKITTITNDNIELSVLVVDFADLSFLEGVDVEFFLITTVQMFQWVMH